MQDNNGGYFIAYEDIWLIDGVRTPFADYNGVLGTVSPIDLGIKVARAVLERTATQPKDVGAAIAARASGMKWREASAIGVLMNTRGLVELIALNLGLQLRELVAHHLGDRPAKILVDALAELRRLADRAPGGRLNLPERDDDGHLQCQRCGRQPGKLLVHHHGQRYAATADHLPVERNQRHAGAGRQRQHRHLPGPDGFG